MASRPRTSSSAGSSAAEPPGQVLRERRRYLGLTQRDLIHKMQQVAVEKGTTLPTAKSLKAMISRWEHDMHTPGPHNRRILSHALGLHESELNIR